MNYTNILNKPLKSVGLNEGALVLTFQDGFVRKFGVEGDCCSRSWIEHLEQPANLTGALITGVEDSESVPWDGTACVNCGVGCGHDHVQVYFTRFHTDRGDITLEYRNDSNGYYGGYLVDLD